jgi:hypothetical protein
MGSRPRTYHYDGLAAAVHQFKEPGYGVRAGQLRGAVQCFKHGVGPNVVIKVGPVQTSEITPGDSAQTPPNRPSQQRTRPYTLTRSSTASVCNYCES